MIRDGGSAASVAIAGAGIIGLSVAWRLAQRGVNVAVFDKSSVGGEASWAGAGMLAPGGEVESASELANLLVESRKLYPAYVRELQDESRIAIDFQENGGLQLAYSAEQWHQIVQRAEHQAVLGVPSKPLSITQITTFWPRVRRQDLIGGLFYPQDATVDPRELVLALAAAAQKAGVKLIQNCAVDAVSLTDNGAQVRTGQGMHSFDVCVIAAGAWSSQIELDGVDPVPESHPVKGQLLGYQQPDLTCNTIVRHGHTYLLQRANGLLIAGASVERVGFDRNISPAITQSLAAEAGFILPHLQETTPSQVWTGFRPGSQSLQLGQWQSPRLYLAYGHFRNGILLAPISGRNVAEQIIANW